MDDLCDALAGKSFLTKTALDVIEHFCVGGVIFIQHIFQLKVCGSKAVAEMLRKNPSTVYETTVITKETLGDKY